MDSLSYALPLPSSFNLFQKKELFVTGFPTRLSVTFNLHNDKSYHPVSWVSLEKSEHWLKSIRTVVARHPVPKHGLPTGSHQKHRYGEHRDNTGRFWPEKHHQGNSQASACSFPGQMKTLLCLPQVKGPLRHSHHQTEYILQGMFYRGGQTHVFSKYLFSPFISKAHKNS